MFGVSDVGELHVFPWGSLRSRCEVGGKGYGVCECQAGAYA